MPIQDGPELGPEVDATPCAVPDNTFSLEGKYVTLEGIKRSHMPSLWQNLDLRKNSYLLDYLPWTVPEDAGALWDILHTLETERGFVVYTISADIKHLNPQATTEPPVDKHNDILGIICYLEIHQEHRDIEVGGVLFSPAVQRTAAATEAHYLLLKNVLQPGSQALAKGTSPPYRRVTWKCNALNKASREAAERLGYKFEGTFRKHWIVKGRSRDTTWLSLIDDDWPTASQALERWLEEKNFDQGGSQRLGLSEIRRHIEFGG